MFMRYTGQSNSQTESRMTVAKGWGEGIIKSDGYKVSHIKFTTEGYKVSFWNDENVLKLDCSNDYTTS